MVTKTEDTSDFQKGKPLLPRASGSVNKGAATSQDHKNKYGNDAIVEPEAQKSGAGVPPGYKPDTSVTYVAGKDGKPDTLKTAAGVEETNAFNGNMGGNQLEVLTEGHTYRDRVEAQAKSLGVPIVEGETLELLLWKIRMMASS